MAEGGCTATRTLKRQQIPHRCGALPPTTLGATAGSSAARVQLPMHPANPHRVRRWAVEAQVRVDSPLPPLGQRAWGVVGAK